MRTLNFATKQNRHYVGKTTSGSTKDVYITDGRYTLKLEDCLIWDSEDFSLQEFDITVKQCKEDSSLMLESGWILV